MRSDEPSADEAAASGMYRRVWWKRLLAILAVGGLAIAGLIGVRLASSLALGSSDIPTQIGGQRVYRVAEQPQWQNQSGSFLLAANLYVVDIICMPITSPFDPAERDLLPDECSGVGLANSAGSTADMPWVSPKSPVYDSLFARPGRDVVLLVHTHDPEAAACGADKRARCEAAVIAEAVIWPPTW